MNLIWGISAKSRHRDLTSFITIPQANSAGRVSNRGGALCSRPLRYRGVACKGEVLFNFHAVSEEFGKTRDPTRFFEFLSQIIVKDQNGLQADAPVDNPALDTKLYRDSEWQEEDLVCRPWCIRSRNVSL